jgi:hypothetical protein
LQFVQAQGGDPRVVDKPELLPAAASVEVLALPCDGYESIDASARRDLRRHGRWEA